LGPVGRPSPELEISFIGAVELVYAQNLAKTGGNGNVNESQTIAAEFVLSNGGYLGPPALRLSTNVAKPEPKRDLVAVASRNEKKLTLKTRKGADSRPNRRSGVQPGVPCGMHSGR
jgi:hypothetical protein